MLFHPDQARELQAILDLADEGNEAFTLPESHDFMYGLAITPDVVALSEWVPIIFGGEMPVSGMWVNAYGGFSHIQPKLKPAGWRKCAGFGSFAHPGLAAMSHVPAARERSSRNAAARPESW